ncbi:MAG: hypothetical protein EOO42_01755 [Flavobacteriales bacterium]|nr:MAG: hypothetical protein EOO42_01755 [Flavobacteriales bacterium]
MLEVGIVLTILTALVTVFYFVTRKKSKHSIALHSETQHQDTHGHMTHEGIERIDLMSDWQDKVSVGLGDVFLIEKETDDRVVSEVWLSTIQFARIVDFYLETFRELNPYDLIYRYHNKHYIGSDEEWAEHVEERIERTVEFLSQLENIDQEFSDLQDVKKEYEVVKNFIRRLLARGNQLYFKADSY